MADWKRGIQNSRSRNILLLWAIGAIFISFFIAGLISAVAFSEFNPILFAAISLVVFSASYYFLLRMFGEVNQSPQKQYQKVIIQAPMGVAMLDTEMNYLAASEAWCTQYDLEVEALVDKNHYEVFPQLRKSPQWQEIYSRGLEGESLSGKEDMFIPKEGVKQFLRWAVCPWHKTGDTVGGIMIYSEDITEVVHAREKEVSQKKELKQKVKERTQLLEQANNDLEAFSYSVSHDLRTPLRAITGFSQILLEDHAEDLGEEGQRLLNIVIDNTQNMATLIDDILSFSRVSRVDLVKTEVNMSQLFADAKTTVIEGHPELQEKTEVEIGELPKAQGDISLLRQVAVNLISNAIKYSANSDIVRVEVGCLKDRKDPTYYVKDNGVGFDMKYVDKLFGVFERLHSRAEFEGTGVGLSLVKRIIDRHDGEVWADSTPGEGATFFFNL